MDLHFENHPFYLQAIFSGPFRSDRIRPLFELTFAKAAEMKAKALLFDTRTIIGKVTLSDRFEMGSNVARLVLHHFGTYTFKVAMITNETLIDPDRFGGIVAENRGARVLVGTNFDEIDAWLKTE